MKPIPQAPPAALLASGGGLMALDTFSSRGWRPSHPHADRLEVLRTRRGTVVARIDHPDRAVSSLAVSGSWLIALSRSRIARASAPRTYLEVWQPPHGRLVRRTALPRGALFGETPVSGRSELSLGGDLVVLSDGVSAWSLRLPGGSLQRVGSDLSVRDAVALDDDHVAWSTCARARDRCTIHVGRAR